MIRDALPCTYNSQPLAAVPGQVQVFLCPCSKCTSAYSIGNLRGGELGGEKQNGIDARLRDLHTIVVFCYSKVWHWVKTRTSHDFRTRFPTKSEMLRYLHTMVAGCKDLLRGGAGRRRHPLEGGREGEGRGGEGRGGEGGGGREGREGDGGKGGRRREGRGTEGGTEGGVWGMPTPKRLKCKYMFCHSK